MYLFEDKPIADDMTDAGSADDTAADETTEEKKDEETSEM